MKLQFDLNYFLLLFMRWNKQEYAGKKIRSKFIKLVNVAELLNELAKTKLTMPSFHIATLEARKYLKPRLLKRCQIHRCRNGRGTTSVPQFVKAYYFREVEFTVTK